VLASFVAQSHLTYVLPAAAMLAIAFGALWAVRPAGVRRALVVAGIAAAVCWSAPLLEQAIHRPGNMVQIVRSATAGKPTLGASAGWHTVVRTVGVDAWWLRAPREPIDRLGEIAARPSLVATIVTLVVLGLLTVAATIGVRRRDPALASGPAIALVVSLAAGVVAASTPSKDNLFISVGYTLWWASFAGAFATLVFGWAATQLISVRLRSRVLVLRRPATYFGIAVAATVGVLVAGRTGSERLQSAYRPVRAAADQLAHESRPTVVEVATGNELFLQFDVQAGLVYGLRARGVRVMASGLTVGRWYRPGAVRPRRRVIVSSRSPRTGTVVKTMRIREVPYGQPTTPRSFHTIAVTATAIR
jgi:hypothetical protein